MYHIGNHKYSPYKSTFKRLVVDDDPLYYYDEEIQLKAHRKHYLLTLSSLDTFHVASSHVHSASSYVIHVYYHQACANEPLHDFRMFNQLDVEVSWEVSFYRITEHEEIVGELLPSRVHVKPLDGGIARVFWKPPSPKKRKAHMMMLEDPGDEEDEAYRDGGTDSDLDELEEDDSSDDDDSSGHDGLGDHVADEDEQDGRGKLP